MASTEAEDPSQSLKYKTSVLRVSIHCQGCKRKVHKLLQSVPGVQEIQIEPKQQRVVVTGDVSPEALLRKLSKAGKHAELWPEKPPEIRTQEPEKPPTTNQGSVSKESPVSDKEIKPPTSTKTEKPVEDPKKASKTAAPGGGEPAVSSGKSDEGVGKSEGGKDSKPEEKTPETESACNQAVSEKKEEKTEKEVAGGGGGGEGKKKKKKKAQNGDKIGSSSSGPPPSIERSVNGGGGGSPPPTRPPINRTPPPQHQGYQFPPPHYYTPPPAPVYTVSYNTAHPPVHSYTASYYASPPPQSYAYSHYGGSQMGPPPHVPPDYDSYRQQPSDSFEMFSDENPNGCLVM